MQAFRKQRIVDRFRNNSKNICGFQSETRSSVFITAKFMKEC